MTVFKSNMDPIRFLPKMINIFKRKSLFLLGAGVSRDYIDLKYNLYGVARKLAYENLSELFFSPANPKELTEVEKSRFYILGGNKHVIHETYNGRLLINETEVDFIDLLIQEYPEILELVCVLTYSLDAYPSYCPEYQIFNLANTESVVVNMNHDNLAEFFIKEVRVLSPHGTIFPNLEMKKIIKEKLSYILDMDMHRSLLKDLYLAAKESESILLGNNDYLKLIEIIENNFFQHLVFVGYSFFKKNDMAIHDIVTHDLIREHIVHGHISNITVIDPVNGDFMIDILANTLKLSNVHSYNISWNNFTHAFYQTNQFKKTPWWVYSSVDQKRFMEFYNYSLFLNGRKKKLLSKFLKRKSVKY